MAQIVDGRSERVCARVPACRCVNYAVYGRQGGVDGSQGASDCHGAGAVLSDLRTLKAATNRR